MTCDVCGSEFNPADETQKRCSDTCRQFAIKHKHAPAKVFATLWQQRLRWTQPCPSGKIRHQKKRDAEKAARGAVNFRYRPVPDWLRVYQCPLCDGWHLTSKPD